MYDIPVELKSIKVLYMEVVVAVFCHDELPWQNELQ